MEQRNEEMSKKEQMVLLLKKAGWYEGRQVDISGFERRCKAEGVELFDSAKQFLQEFSGIDDPVYFKYYDFEFSRNKDSWRDYRFKFIPNAIAKISRPQDYDEILYAAQEDCFCLGESGYYYPAVVGIGRSGKLYFKHDFENVVHVFDSLLDSMEHELEMHDIITSSLYEVMESTPLGNQLSPTKRPNPFLDF